MLETDITVEWLVQLKTAAIRAPVCPVCQGIMTFTDYRARSHAHLDHIIPLNTGGKHLQRNVRFICGECNSKRPKDGRDLDPWDWVSAW